MIDESFLSGHKITMVCCHTNSLCHAQAEQFIYLSRWMYNKLCREVRSIVECAVPQSSSVRHSVRHAVDLVYPGWQNIYLQLMNESGLQSSCWMNRLFSRSLGSWANRAAEAMIRVSYTSTVQPCLCPLKRSQSYWSGMVPGASKFLLPSLACFAIALYLRKLGSLFIKDFSSLWRGAMWSARESLFLPMKTSTWRESTATDISKHFKLFQ